MFIKLRFEDKFWSIFMPTKNDKISKPTYHITYGVIEGTERKSDKTYDEGKAGRSAVLEAVKDAIKKVNAQLDKGFSFDMDSNSEEHFDALVDFSFNAGVGRVNDLIAGNLVSVNSAGKPIKNIVEFEKALRVDFSGVGGIEIRRIQEIEIFLHQNYDNSH